MRRLFTVLGIGAFLATASPAAALLLDTRLICDTDEDTVFGEVGDGDGRARLTFGGELKVRARGLQANQNYTCRLACLSFFAPGLFLNWGETACPTDAEGKLVVTIAVPPDALAGCILPSPVVARGGLVRCFPGLGTYDTTPNP